MASKVKSHFAKIPNSMLEKLSQSNLTSYEFRVCLFIARMTFGYDKEMSGIASRYIAIKTCIDRRHVQRAARKLKKRCILCAHIGARKRITWSIEKDYNKWIIESTAPIQASPNRGPHTGATKAPIEAPSEAPIQAPSKEIKKTYKEAQSAAPLLTPPQSPSNPNPSDQGEDQVSDEVKKEFYARMAKGGYEKGSK